jgi:chromate transporter
MGPAESATGAGDVRVSLATIASQWGRIGTVGFGGPPAHISLLRRLCVADRQWLSHADFEDGIAATNLLPGPASTQLAIYCAWRLRGTAGALIGGVCFILPGLIVILALSALFLGSPPIWIQGAAGGFGAAVAAVAVQAAATLAPGSWRRAGGSSTLSDPKSRAPRLRWAAYLLAGLVAGVFVGSFLVLVLLGCGLMEVAARRTAFGGRTCAVLLSLASSAAKAGGLGPLAWVALKVGLLSYGGGFVIIPLIQSDAVNNYHWMTAGQFLNAVALGQITPGPVVQTVAVVGYAAAGVGGGLLAAAVAFAPSFLMVIVGSQHFDRLRSDSRIQAFLTGAGPAVIGAIAGSAVPLARALMHPWQGAVLAAAVVWLLILRRSVVSALLLAGLGGVLITVI